MHVQQFVMAYGVEQDRLRALLPEGFRSLRPVLRINAEVRDGKTAWVEFNTAVESEGKRGWLNVGHWDDAAFTVDGKTTRFETGLLTISFTGVGIQGGCPAEKDNDGCFFLDEEEALRPAEAITGSNDQVLSALEGYTGRNETFDEGLDQLKTVVKYLSAFGVPEENFAVDLTIARGLDYYTGTVYETALLDHPEIGSVCSGGRYDNLAEYYTDKQLPGVGISIGLTRLFYVLGEQKMLNDNLPTAPCDVLVLPMTEELSPAIDAATALRRAGIRTQLYTEPKKFKAKMNYADKLSVPYVLFLGEDEIAAGMVSCKNMTTGAQTKLPVADAIVMIREDLAERNKGKVIVE